MEHDAADRVRWDSSSVRGLMRIVEDWPNPGIKFLDASPIYVNSEAFDWVIEKVWTEIQGRYVPSGNLPLLIAGLDARGFILGAALAARSKRKMGFVPIRKKGKLPPVEGRMHSVDYLLEYGSAALEVNADDVAGRECVIVDDLLATGGTMAAGAKLISNAGGKVLGAATLVEVAGLDGRSHVQDDGILAGCNIFSLWLTTDS